MQKIIFYTVIILISFVSKTFAQENTFEKRASEIANKIETITTEEKKALKQEIEAFDMQVAKGKITKEKAEELKLKIAQERAANIEAKVAIEQEKLTQLIQDKVDGKINEENNFGSSLIFGRSSDTVTNEREINVTSMKVYKDQEEKEKKFLKRTTSQVVLATGFNNLVTNGKVGNSDYGYLKSVFWEWGITMRTNIIKDNRLLNFKYGVSFMYNALNATDNRYFKDNGNQTVLETYPTNLVDRNTYFKNVYVAVPLHLEFDFSKPQTRNDRTYYRSHTGFRFGIGGFVGYNVNSKQFLEYKSNDYRISERQKGDWNVNDFNYGLSTYVGHKGTSLYLKYDLNPLFKNNVVDQNNISLGLRFDLN
jgi:hypothetical protein